MINLLSSGNFWEINKRPDKYIKVFNYFTNIHPNFFHDFDCLYKMIQRFYYLPIDEIKHEVEYLIKNQYITIIPI